MATLRVSSRKSAESLVASLAESARLLEVQLQRQAASLAALPSEDPLHLRVDAWRQAVGRLRALQAQLEAELQELDSAATT